MATLSRSGAETSLRNNCPRAPAECIMVKERMEGEMERLVAWLDGIG